MRSSSYTSVSHSSRSKNI